MTVLANYDYSKKIRNTEETPSVWLEYTDKEVKNLFIRYRNGDKKAYDLIVKSHMKLVHEIAKHFVNEDDELFDDVIQEGTYGLLKAIELFDYHDYHKFSFYAGFGIQRYIYVSLSSLQHTVRFPLNQVTLHKRLKTFAHNFEQMYGYPPSAVDYDDIDFSDYENVNLITMLPEDLKDITCQVDDLDTFESEIDYVDNLVQNESQKTRIQSLLSRLEQREQFILKRFYGIDTLEENLYSIAQKLNITRERARQILEKTLLRLRHFSGIKRKEAQVGDVIQMDSTEQVGKVISIKKAKDNSNILVLRMESGDVEEISAIGVPYEILRKKIEEKPLPENPISIVDKQKEETLKKKEVAKKEDVWRYVSEYDGVKEGYYILYDNRLCVITKIQVRGNTSKFQVKYSNGVLDWVKNDKTKYKIIHKEDNKQSKRSFLNRSKKADIRIPREAFVGEKISYDSQICTVIEKKIERGSFRLIVEYEDGRIDNIINDWNRYEVVK